MPFPRRRGFGLLLGLAAAGLLLPGPARAASGAGAGPSFADGVRAYEIGDYRDAFRDWLPLASAGDVAAMRNIGTLYRLGRGVAPDPAQAAFWYRKAADLGFARAQSNLAELYLTGEGVPRDAAAAARWFRRAAIQGDGLAAFSLAHLYEKGEGVSRSLPEAQHWYRESLADGYAPAAAEIRPRAAPMPAVAPAFAPTPAPPPAAAEPKAAPPPPDEEPHPLAAVLPAARNGDAGAQYRLGIAFRDGAGVPPDPVRADLWLALAARGGNAAAAAALARLTPDLTPAERAAADRLLGQFRKK